LDYEIYTSYVERLTSGSVSASFNRDGNRIPGVIPNFGDVRVIYDQPSGPLQGVGGYVEAVGRDGFYLDNANLLKAPGYLLMNLDLHYDPPAGQGALSRMRFYIDVQNLLDQTYVGTASNITDSLNASGAQNGAAALANSTGSIYAGTPRSVFGGVRVKF
jgi:iron complex outermembrane recepter protein